MSDEDVRDTDTGKKKGFFSSLKRSKSKAGRGRKNAKSRSMPQLPQSYAQINGHLAVKRTDQFNVSQSAKGGADEDGAVPLPSPTEAGALTECPAQDVSPGSLAGDVAKAGKCAFFALEVELKEGKDLAARDKTDSFSVEFLHEKPVTKTITRVPGTSDPYVKFKSDGKQIYKSKTVSKNLNPQWNEKFCVPIEDITVPLILKVLDFDHIGNDDPMGRAVVDLSQLEIEKPTEMTLDLEDPDGGSEKLGQICAVFTVQPKNFEDRQEISKRASTSKKGQPPKEPGKGQLWDGIVSIILVEGKKMIPMDDSACKETLNPQWKEQFDLKIYPDSPMMLEVTVWDRDIRKDEFMGRCQIDLSTLAREKSHKIEAALEDNAGIVVKLHRAVGLASADIGGTSDPFAVIELNNQRLSTPTLYKTLNPAWDKVYEMTVFDIHDVLDITVFDEDKRGAPEFLGRVVIPLLQVTPGEKRLYQLKDKSLERRAKGHLILTLDVEYNPIRAAVRTRNIDRVNKLVASLVSTGAFVQSLFTWQYKFRSAFAFAIYIMLCLNFDFYIIPLTLLLTFLKQYVMCMLLADRNVNPEEQEGAPVDEDDDLDEEEEDKGKKGDKGKSFKEKIAALTSICQTVQNALDMVASMGERVKNTFNWTVPFCSYLMCVIFTLGTVVLYIVPLKFLLLAWGINKFTKKIRKPNAVDNNELMDFLSRIPSDIEVKEQKVLKTDPSLRLKRIDG
ncbi:Multiple C2 and transmembrane domain-containing protein 1 [Acropora cervicornis]|uniref:Multiple C2 and transmembrane domain-containing protein 1 n=1 Tax=Acropora cervicornis TaxID=6130 RepID=A0AAD9QND8_ACRCE|nr:Multiple C2 and transmembrane domain-containing protein 1 [Acropora cervicornis]